MAWFRLSRPGVDNGPCAHTCAHTDCAESRRTASAICPHCGQACGYNRQLTYVATLTGNEPAHFVCVCKEAGK